MNAMERFRQWLAQLPEEHALYAELQSLSEEEINERFHSELAFGTAGLRGKTGAGTNRMNEITVGRAVQGIADYICSFGEDAKKRGVVIVHDPRHYSAEFSKLSAEILCAAGIRTYMFDDLRPTPELAFLIRYLHTVSGINITASHNPKEYNGLKAYWEDGCQVGSETADAMTECIQKVDPFHGIRHMDLKQAEEAGLLVHLGEEHDRAYLDCIKELAVHADTDLDLSIPIVYTPLNGAGAVPFMQVMKERGFTACHIVEEQRLPDPDFTTVGYPNPEDPKAFARSEILGRETGAELLIATDPDADRLAIEIRDEEGNYIPLNGNQTGYILVAYLLEGLYNAGLLPESGAVVKSIVTGSMSTDIAAAYGVKVFETLTGFKNICGRIPQLEEDGYTYLFGYEESVGYAPSSDIRDKDGIAAGMLVAEAAAYCRKRGKTLYQTLKELYAEYGWWAEDEPNIVLEGIAGAERIKRMMAWLRANPLSEAGGIPVKTVIDFAEGYEDIPPANVLKYILEDGSWFAVRPSGTEPKIKFYFYSKQDDADTALAVNRKIRDDVFAAVTAVS